MLFPKLPEVKILDEIDTEKIPWCSEAVVFSVKNGRRSLINTKGQVINEGNDFFFQLELENKPVLQEIRPQCPTCEGMLAAGYGIENINCPELKAVREGINTGYKDIHTSAEFLKPFLGLLDNGIYVLADVSYYPTDGNGRFFYSVPNGFAEYPVTCDVYYVSSILACADGFPAYLYPTQSSELINTKRVEEYMDILKNDPSPPRGLAYWQNGFISALLDGHHKACAAARLGKKISCLTIIRADGFRPAGEYNRSDMKKTFVKDVIFSTIEYPAKEGQVWGDYFSDYKENKIGPPFPEYKLTGREFPEENRIAAQKYPTIDLLSGMYASDIITEKITEELIDKLISKPDRENAERLRFALAYLMITGNREMAYIAAKKIVRAEISYHPAKEAWVALQEFKCDETEQLMIDYMVSHTKDDPYWDIVSDYWD
ncbi:MAG: hypothetical protein J1E40_02735 [Oscillospiraceae bacterium]|nr:hypothetical protein [Oscillospiraceae bacterium]